MVGPGTVFRQYCSYAWVHLKRVGMLNALATEENSSIKFVKYWIAAQAYKDTYLVVKTKPPSPTGQTITRVVVKF